MRECSDYHKKKKKKQGRECLYAILGIGDNFLTIYLSIFRYSAFLEKRKIIISLSSIFHKGINREGENLHHVCLIGFMFSRKEIPQMHNKQYL